VARTTTGPLTSLVKQLDEQIAKNKELRSFLVILTDDEEKTASALKTLAEDGKLKSVPLTLIADTKGPAIYQIAEDAEVTVMMWRGSQVKVNHAYAKGELTDADVKSLIAEIPKILK
jgi:predicted transcriptional regulator